MRQLHVADSQGFLIDHDNYYSTHSPENQHYSELIYTRLQEAGLIFTEQVEQLYDPEKGCFWQTALSSAAACAAKRPISMATTAKPAAPPTTPMN